MIFIEPQDVISSHKAKMEKEMFFILKGRKIERMGNYEKKYLKESCFVFFFILLMSSQYNALWHYILNN